MTFRLQLVEFVTCICIFYMYWVQTTFRLHFAGFVTRTRTFYVC